MNTTRIPPERSKLVQWLKKRTEGEQLLEWAVYIIIFVVLVVFVIDHPTDMASWRFFGTVISLAMVLVLNILWFEQEHNLPANLANASQWGFLAVSSALLLAAIWMGELFNSIYLFFMLCTQAAVILGVWPLGLVFSLINMAAWLVVGKAIGLSNTALGSLALSLSVGILFVLLLAMLLERYSQQTRRAERLLVELQDANNQLQAARQKEKELAIAEERVRLARDIHDGLGHHLTVLSIQLQAASKLVERNPKAAAEAIQLCRAEAQAALEEVRTSVGVMRQLPSESQSLREALANLIHDYEQGTGIYTSFEQDGAPVELASFARQTIYRAVQESLTNAQKHGKGVQHVWVRLEYALEAVRLTVQNDGQAGESPPPDQAGFGLTGLNERVHRLGGAIHSGPDEEGGFMVELSIPLQEVVYDPGRAG